MSTHRSLYRRLADLGLTPQCDQPIDDLMALVQEDWTRDILSDGYFRAKLDRIQVGMISEISEHPTPAVLDLRHMLGRFVVALRNYSQFEASQRAPQRDLDEWIRRWKLELAVKLRTAAQAKGIEVPENFVEQYRLRVM